MQIPQFFLNLDMGFAVLLFAFFVLSVAQVRVFFFFFFFFFVSYFGQDDAAAPDAGAAAVAPPSDSAAPAPAGAGAKKGGGKVKQLAAQVQKDEKNLNGIKQQEKLAKEKLDVDSNRLAKAVVDESQKKGNGARAGAGARRGAGARGGARGRGGAAARGARARGICFKDCSACRTCAKLPRGKRIVPDDVKDPKCQDSCSKCSTCRKSRGGKPRAAGASTGKKSAVGKKAGGAGAAPAAGAAPVAGAAPGADAAAANPEGLPAVTPNDPAPTA